MNKNTVWMVGMAALGAAVCAPVEADLPAGACCFYDDDCNLLCEIVSETLCNAVNGVFLGEGTDCTNDPCEDYGACCFLGNLSCEDLLTEQACLDSGGVWQGACTSCDVITCPLTAACCLPDGVCMRLTHDDCADLGDLYQGFPTDCATVECVGACCFDDGTCLAALTWDDCEIGHGGHFQGHGSGCESSACPFRAHRPPSQQRW